MSDAHAILTAAWAAGDDTTPLLVLADLFDEVDQPDAAEVLRLVVAEGFTSRHSRERAARLKQLREDAWRRVKDTAWPNMAVQGNAGAASFSRRPDPDRPDREQVVVRPDRRTLHRFRIELDGHDEVVRTADGRELLRRRLRPDTITFIHERGDVYWSAGFSIGHDHFPFPDGWQADPDLAEAEQLRQLEVALAPAAIPVAELPAELVPFVAWVLCEHVMDRDRRARDGAVVPGAHLFLFRPADGWRHAQSLENREAGRAVTSLRQRFRRDLNGGRGVLAGLLVRVADDGRIAARKLLWVGSGGTEVESLNLHGATSTLSAEEFRRAAEDMEMDDEVAGRFVLEGVAGLRGVFATPEGIRT
jgi:uncharacterized protein (TIGR02996 family)